MNPKFGDQCEGQLPPSIRDGVLAILNNLQSAYATMGDCLSEACRPMPASGAQGGESGPMPPDQLPLAVLVDAAAKLSLALAQRGVDLTLAIGGRRTQTATACASHGRY